MGLDERIERNIIDRVGHIGGRAMQRSWLYSGVSLFLGSGQLEKSFPTLKEYPALYMLSLPIIMMIGFYAEGRAAKKEMNKVIEQKIKIYPEDKDELKRWSEEYLKRTSFF